MLTFAKRHVKLSPYRLRKLVEEVFKRDDFRCQIPGCNNTKSWYTMAPHHIIPRARLRLDIKENLLTVCIGCHALLHANLLDVSIDDLIDQYKLRRYLK